MPVIDLTHTIRESMPVYPGTEPPVLSVANTYEKDGFKETLLRLYSHTGTHVDAPAHLFAGRTTLDAFPVSQFAGKGLVIHCPQTRAGELISMSAVQAVRDKADKADFLLFHTGWNRYWGRPEYFGDYPCIDMETAAYVRDSHKKGVGFDTIGIDPIAEESLPRHRLLLSDSEIVIIENLTNLAQVGYELFDFFALPLKYENGDGAPVRAIAVC